MTTAKSIPAHLSETDLLKFHVLSHEQSESDSSLHLFIKPPSGAVRHLAFPYDGWLSEDFLNTLVACVPPTEVFVFDYYKPDNKVWLLPNKEVNEMIIDHCIDLLDVPFVTPQHTPPCISDLPPLYTLDLRGDDLRQEIRYRKVLVKKEVYKKAFSDDVFFKLMRKAALKEISFIHQKEKNSAKAVLRSHQYLELEEEILPKMPEDVYQLRRRLRNYASALKPAR